MRALAVIAAVMLLGSVAQAGEALDTATIRIRFVFQQPGEDVETVSQPLEEEEGAGAEEGIPATLPPPEWLILHEAAVRQMEADHKARLLIDEKRRERSWFVWMGLSIATGVLLGYMGERIVDGGR